MPWIIPADSEAIRFLDRSISQNRLSHAYLLTGPAGVGAMALAKEFSKALLCDAVEERPCGECRNCRRIANGVHSDVLTIGPTAAGSIGIEATRELQAAASLQPYESTGRVIIIGEADSLTREASNALLKLLEEPHPGVTLILVTSNEEGVPETVRSRCQIVPMRPIPFDRVAEALQAEGAAAEDALRLARISGGRLESALELLRDTTPLDARRAALEEILETRSETISSRLRRAGKMGDDFYANRQQLLERLEVWAAVWRDALMVAAGAPEEVIDPAEAEQLGELSVSVPQALDATTEILGTIKMLKQNANARLALESLLMALP